MYKKFKLLLKKYYKRTATTTEDAIVNRFFDALQVGGLTEIEVQHNRQLYLRLQHKILSKTSASFVKYKIFKYGSIAASIFGVGILYFILFTTTEVQYVVHEAKKGEQLVFYLKDSTLVYLNSNSTLRFPSNFKSDTREVILDGEAYFNVSRKEDQPFIVHSSNLSTTVLGTAFNIIDFPNETTSVSVHEGKVRVKASTNQEVVLTENEQVKWDKYARIFTKEEVDLHDFNQWITGRIQFNNTSISEVIQVLNRRFNCVIECEATPQTLSKYIINGDFKGTNIEEVLQGLHFIYNIRYVKVANKHYKLFMSN